MIDNKTVLVVITARAGSKGLPGKNFKDFCGKPLVDWSVIAGLNCNYVDKVAISSNCEEVKKSVEKYLDDKCVFIDRPDSLSTGISKNESALIHSYNEMLSNGFDADIIINLQPTSPLRRKTLIADVLSEMIRGKHDSAFTVSEHTPFFVQLKDEGVQWFYDPKNRPMRQDIADSDMMLHDDGCLYAVESDYLLKHNCRIGDNPLIFKNDHAASFQIDDELDFIVLENLKKKLDETNEYI